MTQRQGGFPNLKCLYLQSMARARAVIPAIAERAYKLADAIPHLWNLSTGKLGINLTKSAAKLRKFNPIIISQIIIMFIRRENVNAIFPTNRT
jgi:hypothetical protein